MHLGASNEPTLCERALDMDPEMHELSLSSRNPRTYRFRGLNDLLSKLKPDIVHLEVDPVSLLVLNVGKWIKKNSTGPLTCLSCENLPQDLPAILKRRGLRGLPGGIYKSWINNRAQKMVDHVFTLSDDGTRLFKSMNYQGVSKIPLGFDPTFFNVNHNSRARIRKQLNIESVLFAYFGRLVKEKGVHLLLESLGTMKHLEWKLMLDQFEEENEYSHSLKIQIQELGLAERVLFVHAQHGQIADYMNASDIVILPSLSTPKWKEQYGRVAPEAMACGKLVIVARSGALPELVGEYGITFEEDNVEELTKALLAAFNKPCILDYNKRAAQYAVNKLGVESQAALMNHVFEELIQATEGN